MIQVIDNVIGKLYQNSIEDRLLHSSEFTWQYNAKMTSMNESNNCGFFHSLIRLNSPIATDHLWLNYFYPLVYEIADKANVEIKQLFAGRAFLQLPGTSNFKVDKFHVDFQHPHMVFLYYVNDSDGDTLISSHMCEQLAQDITKDISEEEIVERVSPKKGRAVIFDGRYYHAAGIPKNNSRAVLNFNITERQEGKRINLN
jgi:hypothetical protein